MAFSLTTSAKEITNRCFYKASRGGRANPVATGLSELDSAIKGGGLPDGDLTVVFGAVGTGKSRLLARTAIAAARAGTLVIFLGPQYPSEVDACRALISAACNGDELIEGVEAWNAAHEIESLPLELLQAGWDCLDCSELYRAMSDQLEARLDDAPFEKAIVIVDSATMVGFGEPGIRQAVRVLKDYAKDDERAYRLAILASVTCDAREESELADAGCLVKLNGFSREGLDLSVVKHPWSS